MHLPANFFVCLAVMLLLPSETPAAQTALLTQAGCNSRAIYLTAIAIQPSHLARLAGV